MMQGIQSPIGWLRIQENDGKLVDIEFLSRKPTVLRKPSAMEKKVAEQLEKYFQKKIQRFSLPLKLAGTDFQLRVWQALQEISFGQVKTYGQLARELNSSARAVGNACRANPIPIIVPCHRVVAANGIGGYAGKTAGPVLARKRWLLAHEGVL